MSYSGGHYMSKSPGEVRDGDDGWLSKHNMGPTNKILRWHGGRGNNLQQQKPELDILHNAN